MTSPGFDDEIVTLQVAYGSPDIGSILAWLRTQDVHPPISYLLPWAWVQSGLPEDALRALIGAINALALFALWRAFAPRTAMAVAFAYIVICLNPTLLLWGATLRWYSLALPLVVAMLLWLRANPAPPWRFWGGLTLGGVVLAYIGYACLLFLPGFFVAAMVRRGWPWRAEGMVILTCAAVLAALVLPQLLWVLPDQMVLGHGAQAHGWLRQLGGLGVHLLLGHAAMPLGFASLAFLVGNLLLLAGALRKGDLALGSTGALVLIPALLAALVARVAASFRNLAVLVPAQALWQVALFARIGGKLLSWSVLACFAAGTLAGLWNVIAREDTSKSGWNRPYWQILDVVEAAHNQCSDLVVATHDPVVTWHLDRRGIPVMDVPFQNPGEAIGAHEGCLAVVESYHVRRPMTYQRDLSAGVAARPGALVHQRLGFDRHATFKRRFDPRFPDYSAVVTVFGPLSVTDP